MTELRDNTVMHTEGLVMPHAILWDMDGTLVDSEPLWQAMEKELVYSGGGQWTEADALALVGSPLHEAAIVLHNAGAPLAPELIVDELVSRVSAMVRAEVPWRQAGRETLQWVRKAGIPSALVTMSHAPIAQAMLDAITPGTFAAIVTGDEVTNGKPHPEPYLRAAELLGVDPRKCIAVEDSPRGIAAAMASGARTIGIVSVVPVKPQPGLSRVTELDQITPAVLDAIMRGETVDFVG